MSASPRQRLPNRRDRETFSFSWLVMSFAASISRYSDGKLAEIFLASPKVGHPRGYSREGQRGRRLTGASTRGLGRNPTPCAAAGQPGYRQRVAGRRARHS